MKTADGFPNAISAFLLVSVLFFRTSGRTGTAGNNEANIVPFLAISSNRSMITRPSLLSHFLRRPKWGGRQCLDLIPLRFL
jgi:hypothetical protein